MKFEFTTQPTFTKADNQVTSQTNPLISAFDTMQNMCDDIHIKSEHGVRD